MRTVNQTKGNSLYLVNSFNTTGKVVDYKTIYQTTGSMKDAKSIARRELMLGASHVNISKVICHCFNK